MKNLNWKIRHAPEGSQARKELLVEKRQVQRQMLSVPNFDQYDPNYRKLVYCRYADDFVLGFIGPKCEAEDIARKIETFLHDILKLRIATDKSGMKHHSEIVRFLGYDIMIRSSEKVKKVTVRGYPGIKRTVKGRVTLHIPEDKLQKFADKHRYGNWETLEGTHRWDLCQLSDAEIVLHSSAELRGLAQYYALARNFSKALNKLRILWMRSFLKTMACKHQTTVQKMATMLNRGNYYAVKMWDKEGKEKEYPLFRLKLIDREKARGAAVDDGPFTFHLTSGTELHARMTANKCEYCRKEGGYFEIHHVRKLADIKEGTEKWQRKMIERQRKTLVLCIDCHKRLTAGTLPDYRTHLVDR